MKWILEQVASPILRRLGSLTAGFLAGQGVPQDDVAVIVNGLTIGGLVLVDLAISFLGRKGR